MSLLKLRLRAMRHEAEGICSLELEAAGGEALPPFTAGAHLDLHLSPGLVRSYSLCNMQGEARYVVAVNRDPRSRGGSVHVHDRLRVGQLLDASAPRNNFQLDETAAHTVLVAGGIGITPLLAMARRLAVLGKAWELHYCARSRAAAAFVPELEGLAAGSSGRLHLHFDDAGRGLLDLRQLVAAAPRDAHFYCCGPQGLLSAFEAATAHLARPRVHLEYFAAKDAPATGGGFTVELARSQRSVHVAPGHTILDALLAAGLDVPHSCMQGVCGACETPVLAGEPDHRDMVLGPEEQASNRTMMLCCSGAKSERLVLDL